MLPLAPDRLAFRPSRVKGNLSAQALLLPVSISAAVSLAHTHIASLLRSMLVGGLPLLYSLIPSHFRVLYFRVIELESLSEYPDSLIIIQQ